MSGPRLRLMVLWDANYISKKDADSLGNILEGMNLDVVLAAICDLTDGPIRILNIDAIPPETIESIKAKADELFGARQPRVTKFKGDCHDA